MRGLRAQKLVFINLVDHILIQRYIGYEIEMCVINYSCDFENKIIARIRALPEFLVAS